MKIIQNDVVNRYRIDPTPFGDKGLVDVIRIEVYLIPADADEDPRPYVSVGVEGFEFLASGKGTKARHGRLPVYALLPGTQFWSLVEDAVLDAITRLGLTMDEVVL